MPAQYRPFVLPASHALWVRLDRVQGLSIACTTTPCVFGVSWPFAMYSLLYCRRSHALWVRHDCVQGLSIAYATAPVVLIVS